MTRPLKFVDQNIDDYAMKVTYDPVKGTGKLVYNISLVKNEDFEYAVSILKGRQQDRGFRQRPRQIRLFGREHCRVRGA